MEYIVAFIIGGGICAILQIVLDVAKIQPGNMMVMLVCLGALLGFLGVYEPFADWAKAGATVPLLGFGNMLYEGVMEEYKSAGMIGLVSGGLKNTAVGIGGALLFAYIGAIVFQPRMPRK